MTSIQYAVGCLLSLLVSGVALAVLPLNPIPRRIQIATVLGMAGVVAALGFAVCWAVHTDASVALESVEWIRLSVMSPFWFSTILLLLVCGGALEYFDSEATRSRTDHFLFLILSAIGALSLVCASNLITAICAWELVALPLTLATANKRLAGQRSVVSLYFADFFSFVLMVLGIALIFAQYQTLSLLALEQAVQSESHSSDILLYTGIALWLSGTLTRLGVLPFQGVLYDRVSSGPIALAGFAGIFLPVSATAFFWEFFGNVLRPTLPQWADFISALGLLTLWAGSLGMLAQTSWRRFIAHALIAQSGWVLMAVVTSKGDLEAQTYMLVLTNSVALLAITFGAVFLQRNGGTQAVELSKGLLQQHPGVAFVLATGYLTLAGVPPLGGFAARAQLLTSLASDGSPGIAFLASISIAIAAYPCLRRLSPLLDPHPVIREWVRPGKVETALFCVVALGLWLVGIVPSIVWPG